METSAMSHWIAEEGQGQMEFINGLTTDWMDECGPKLARPWAARVVLGVEWAVWPIIYY